MDTLNTIERDKVLSQEAWLAEHVKSAPSVLCDCVEVNPNKRGGIPVLKGTRFTVAQLFAELADGRSVIELAEAFELDLDNMKALLQGFSTHLDRPMAP